MPPSDDAPQHRCRCRVFGGLRRGPHGGACGVHGARYDSQVTATPCCARVVKPGTGGRHWCSACAASGGCRRRTARPAWYGGREHTDYPPAAPATPEVASFATLPHTGQRTAVPLTGVALLFTLLGTVATWVSRHRRRTAWTGRRQTIRAMRSSITSTRRVSPSPTLPSRINVAAGSLIWR